MLNRPGDSDCQSQLLHTLIEPPVGAQAVANTACQSPSVATKVMLTRQLCAYLMHGQAHLCPNVLAYSTAACIPGKLLCLPCWGQKLYKLRLFLH